MDKPKERKSPRELIVSSAHLAGGSSPALSELEYGLILFSHAFNRWMVRCMAAAGVPSLSPVEILIILDRDGQRAHLDAVDLSAPPR